MQYNLADLLEIATRAARAAAEIHREGMERGGLGVETKRTALDLVTEIDRAAERELVKVIHAARPEDAIIGEEGTNVSGDSRVRWILDPLDGTVNFIHHYPAHSVAIGVEIDGVRSIGVVHDSYNNNVYAGIVGSGATCNGNPISVGSETDLTRALVGTGFLPDAGVRERQADLLRRVLPRVRDIRRSGCPSLDICSVAAGKLDAFYEYGLGPWDIAGAAAIAEAAGAKVLLRESTHLPSPLLVVANEELADGLVPLLT